MFKVEKTDYYAVDHTPNYLWESASRSISAALVVHLPTMVDGRAQWQKNEVIRRAINVDSGVVVKPSVLSFQNREAAYPHVARELAVVNA
jgi:N5-(carboxyethyl)ornithine synthase